MTLDVRVRRLSGTALTRPEHLRCDSIDYSAALNEVAALRLQLSQAEAVNGPVHDGEELALEIWDGSRWTEPEAGRFSVLGRSLDELDPTRATATDVVEYVSFRLAGALLATQGGDRTYTDVTPGWMLDGILDEAQARGAAEGVVWSFTATHDSTGAPWAKTLTMDLPADQPATETLAVLVAGGFIDWTTRGRELVVYARESAGVKRGFTIGKMALERPVRTSLAGVATDVILRLEDGRSIRKSGNGGLGLGVLERSISASGVTDQGTLDLLAAAELAGAAPKTELTISETAKTLDRVPLVHYDLGDWVLVRRAGSIEEVRVSSVQLRRGTDAVLTVDIGLMDRLADTASKLAKRAKSLGNIGGNGRFKSSGGGGGVSVRYGTVHPGYINYSGSPARVSFNGGTTFSDPLDFISEHPPFAGDRVAVVGNLIVGRIAAEPGEVPGSLELLQPGPGWRELDPARYGPLSIRRTGSEWVFLNGVLERDPSYAGPDPQIAAYIPGAYRPARATSTMQFLSRRENGVHVGTTLTLSSGELRSQSSTADTMSISGIAWNTQTHSLWNIANNTRGGVDVEGTAFFIQPPGNVYGSAQLPSDELAPARLQGFQVAYQWHATLNPVNRTLNATFGGSAPGNMAWELLHWQTHGSSDYAFAPLTPINGYTWNPADPFEYGKTPSGIVRLRGRPGGGGVAGATAAILPPGYRPSYEVMLPNGLRITPSGAVSNVSTTGNGGTGAANNGAYDSRSGAFVTAFIAGR